MICVHVYGGQCDISYMYIKCDGCIRVSGISFTSTINVCVCVCVCVCVLKIQLLLSGYSEADIVYYSAIDIRSSSFCPASTLCL